jgi:preprotein translocase subunit SecY
MNKDLINKILITMGLLLFYRVMAYIPVPGIDIGVLQELLQNNKIVEMANIFNGNAISRFSIISLGIMPYITASIIMELMAATFANIKILKKTQEGMFKYIQYIRYLTIVITIVQSFSIAFMLMGSNGVVLIEHSLFLFLTVISLTTGTLVLMWLGEKITQHGIGNGISLIIFASIVTGIPSAIASTFVLFDKGGISFFTVLITSLLIITTVVTIIYIELAERRLPLSYIKNNTFQNTNFLPIKINLAGVIPPIFASAILILPTTTLSKIDNQYAVMISDMFSPGNILYNISMFFLVIFFAYFYTSITFNTQEISENLKKEESYFDGFRPLEETKLYLDSVVSRLTFVGSIYLAIISTIPFIFIKELGVPFYFGGPMVLIIVQVALDTMKKIEASFIANKYIKNNNKNKL